MLEQLPLAKEVFDNSDKSVTQEDVNAATSALNVAINTMRPGNLAEPEDLEELIVLVTDTKENIPNKTTELREAIDFADMVISYVNDGSGTKDFIQRGIDVLNKARKTVGK